MAKRKNVAYAAKDAGSRNVRDIRFLIRGRGANLDRQVSGSISLSYMRGFQAGYEQAVKDSKRGRLNIDNALFPSRAESPRS